jgi:regulator of RNase E activity RraA
VVGDILDTLGCYHQFLPQPIQPIRESDRLAGRAMPVLIADCHGAQARPFGKLTDSLDQLEPGEVYVATGGEMRCAYWGEILTATSRMRGALGAVVNGYHRACGCRSSTTAARSRSAVCPSPPATWSSPTSTA